MLIFPSQQYLPLQAGWLEMISTTSMMFDNLTLASCSPQAFVWMGYGGAILITDSDFEKIVFTFPHYTKV